MMPPVTTYSYQISNMSVVVVSVTEVCWWLSMTFLDHVPSLSACYRSEPMVEINTVELLTLLLQITIQQQ